MLPRKVPLDRPGQQSPVGPERGLHRRRDRGGPDLGECRCRNSRLPAISPGVAPGEEAVAQACGGPFGVGLAEGFSLLFARFEIGVEVGLVFEVVAENLVDIGKVEGGIALGDFFGGGAAVEGSHDEVEGYAGSSDAVDAVGVLRERDCFQKCGHA